LASVSTATAYQARARLGSAGAVAGAVVDDAGGGGAVTCQS
jgi:hypothetical protein